MYIDKINQKINKEFFFFRRKINKEFGGKHKTVKLVTSF